MRARRGEAKKGANADVEMDDVDDSDLKMKRAMNSQSKKSVTLPQCML